MKKVILILTVILSVSLNAQTVSNTFKTSFKYDTVSISVSKNLVVDKVDLYESALTFFKQNKGDKEFIYFNSLPLHKYELDTTRYTTESDLTYGKSKFRTLVRFNGEVNATFIDENNKRYNIGVSCYNNKFIYYVTSDVGANQSTIKAKIVHLKQTMISTKPSTVKY